jgi:peptidoglycan hydrolase CwlO-like protein
VQKSKAISLITKEGQRLGSLLLTSLAVRSAADPFAKVKGLIQKLMERLLEEAEGESTKKGFCDTELAKNRKERDFRFEDTNDLSDELGGLEAKRDKLTQEIKELTTDLKTLNKDYKSTVADRKTTKAENTETVKTAKEGLEAVNKALLTLKAFYDQAAKAAFIQESQPSAGFQGSYSGKQEGTHAILGLLDTIASDFDRTINIAEQNEDDAQREFVKFTQTTKSSIAAKEKTKLMDEQDLKTTKTSLKTKMEDLKTAQKLLDGALKELEELKPTCIDTGMSYKDRVAKREEEMSALKKALCLLDEENVEALCK